MSYERIYDLNPIDNRLSFYGKAKVAIQANGDEILLSYNTPIIRKTADGKIIRLYDKWSLTTGRHIKAFCGLTKKEYDKLPIEAA